MRSPGGADSDGLCAPRRPRARPAPSPANTGAHTHHARVTYTCAGHARMRIAITRAHAHRTRTVLRPPRRSARTHRVGIFSQLVQGALVAGARVGDAVPVSHLELGAANPCLDAREDLADRAGRQAGGSGFARPGRMGKRGGRARGATRRAPNPQATLHTRTHTSSLHSTASCKQPIRARIRPGPPPRICRRCRARAAPRCTAART